MTDPRHFQVGPPVDETRHLYIERPAERRMRAYLDEGRDVLLVGPPRLGKTTLGQRAMAEWEKRGWSAAVLRCDAVMGKSDPRRWASEAIGALTDRLDSDLEPPSADRATRILTDGLVALVEERGPLLLIVDEINALVEHRDTARALLDSLAALRAKPEVSERLRLCLMGTTELRDLAGSETANPLSGLDRVTLSDFVRSDLSVLEEGFEGFARPGLWLDAIFQSVGGHPLLVQRLARAAALGEISEMGEMGDLKASKKRSAIFAAVEGYCESLLSERPRDAIFEIVDEALEQLPTRERLDVLDLYSRVPRGPENDDEEHALYVEEEQEEVAALRLRNLGLVRLEYRAKAMHIAARSPLFEVEFDEPWIDRRIGELHRPFGQDARRWRSEGGLEPDISPRRLTATLALMDEDPDALSILEAAYYQACQRRDRRLRRRRSVLQLIGAAVVIGAMAVGLVVTVQAARRAEAAERTAQDAERTAQDAERRALVSREAAEAAIEALQRAPAGEAANSLPTRLTAASDQYGALTDELPRLEDPERIRVLAAFADRLRDLSVEAAAEVDRCAAEEQRLAATEALQDRRIVELESEISRAASSGTEQAATLNRQLVRTRAQRDEAVTARDAAASTRDAARAELRLAQRRLETAELRERQFRGEFECGTNRFQACVDARARERRVLLSSITAIELSLSCRQGESVEACVANRHTNWSTLEANMRAGLVCPSTEATTACLSRIDLPRLLRFNTQVRAALGCDNSSAAACLARIDRFPAGCRAAVRNLADRLNACGDGSSRCTTAQSQALQLAQNAVVRVCR